MRAELPCAARVESTRRQPPRVIVTGSPSSRRHPTLSRSFGLVWFLAVVFLLALNCLRATGADNGSGTTQPTRTDETNIQETLRSYIQLQEQLHQTQLTVEQTRKEVEAAAAKNAQALSGRLEAIEGALTGQRAHELDAMQSSNRVMLFMAGTFASLGFVAMLLMGYFQWRTVHGLAEISAVLPPARGLRSGAALAALGAGDTTLGPSGQVEQANARLVGALEQLERRICELERASRPALEEGVPGTGSDSTPALHSNGHGDTREGSTAPPVTTKLSPGETGGSRIQTLLAAGQALLDQDQAENALASFEQALALDPQHAEALVKKGTALERLHKLDEAIECYNQAINADNSLTIAYLHKGGLFNRLERFSEALECYEKALRTQEKRAA